jgi:glycosyltransferase involved in cell wall biosynthesis
LRQRSCLRRCRILITIVLPAYNEELYLAATIEELIDGLTARGLEYELIVAENGSTDRTRAVGEKLAAEHANVRMLALDVADYGNALRAGFLEATGDVVANFDVDYFDLEFLDRAREMLERDHCAIVVAAKRGTGATDTRVLPRRIVTAAFAAVLRVAFKLNVVDTHGMKLMDRRVVAPLVTACHSGTDLFDTELVIRVERAGLKVASLPVTVEERRASRTSVVRRIPRSVHGLGRLWLQLRREGL